MSYERNGKTKKKTTLPTQVGKDSKFTIVENEAIQPYLDGLEKLDGTDEKGDELEDGITPTAPAPMTD